MKKVRIAVYMLCASFLQIAFAQSAYCGYTAASSESNRESSSEATWADGFPIVGVGTSVLTPSGAYYMPTSSPNPAYKATPDQSGMTKAEPQHEVKALVQNYSWTTTPHNQLAVKSQKQNTKTY